MARDPNRWRPPPFKKYQLFAVSKCGLIGRDNALPWSYPEDLSYFKERTSSPDCAVVMGYKTWESLPLGKVSGEKLPGRKKIVYTHKELGPLKDTIFVKAIDGASLRKIVSPLGIYNLYYIGGKSVIEESKWSIDAGFITVVDLHFPRTPTDVRIDKEYVNKILKYGKVIKEMHRGQLNVYEYNRVVADQREMDELIRVPIGYGNLPRAGINTVGI